MQAEKNRTTLRTAQLEINLVTRGPVPEEAEEQAVAEIESIAARAPRDVTFARVKLTQDRDRAAGETCIAQGALDMSGTVVRAQVAAPSMREAVDTLGERLEANLRRISERRRTLRSRPPQTPEGSWRSGELPTRRPSYHPRPAEDRKVIRRKAFGLAEATPEEALFDLEALDHRFFLFRLAGSDDDAVVYETDEGYALRTGSGRMPDSDLGVEQDPTPAPTLSIDQAKDLLDASRAPFVFFRPSDAERAHVLYRRYDGHYGLIEPRD